MAALTTFFVLVVFLTISVNQSDAIGRRRRQNTHHARTGKVKFEIFDNINRHR